MHDFFKYVLTLNEMQSQYPRICVDDHHFNIVYRHNPRAKRLSMRMSADYQGVLITVPLKCAKNDLERFLSQCCQWLIKTLPKWISRRIHLTLFEPGSILPILGRSTKVFFDASGNLKKISLQDDRLIVPNTLNHPSVIRAFLNKQLFEYVNQKSKAYADILGVNVGLISIKPLKASYGICSSKKTISYASKLVFAPVQVIDYVCAHEVAHLKEMNHSAAFWQIVSELMPEYKIHKAWLKTYGYTLQRYERA